MQRALQWLPLIVLAALLLRVGYAWNYRATHSEQALRTIPFLYEPGNIAAALADGQGYSSPLRVESGPTAWMTPVYPLLLAGVFGMFGKYTSHAWEAAVALNILFGTLTCIPVIHIGRRVGGATIGALAGWLWAIFPNALILPVESMWDASLAALLGACIVLYTLRARAFRNVWGWIGYGVLWGLALMTSATFILAFPFLLAWMAWQARVYRAPTIAAAVTVLTCAPWTVRNALVLHAFVPLRSVGGITLWMGTIDPDGGRWPGSYHPLADATERERFLQLGELAYMQAKQAEAMAFIGAHPAVEARLSAQRFVGFWAGGALHPFSAFLQNRSAWFRFVLLFNVAAGVAALAGIWRFWRLGDQDAIPVAIMPIVIPFAFYLSLASARYRMLVDPSVMVLAAAAFATRAQASTLEKHDG